MNAQEFDYFASHSALTDPGRHAGLFRDAPSDEAALARWVRNVHFHETYAMEAGLELPPDVAGDPATSWKQRSTASCRAIRGRSPWHGQRTAALSALAGITLLCFARSCVTRGERRGCAAASRSITNRIPVSERIIG